MSPKNRKPIQLNPQPVIPIRESQRFSLDFVENLQIILEEKRIPTIQTEAQIIAGSKEMYKSDKMLYQEDEEDKENLMGNINKRVNDTLLLEERDISQWERDSDESFEAFEKMCNKTASDPDSTLFQYLHSDHQEQVLANVKKRSFKGGDVQESKKGFDAESMALQRLLDDLCVEKQQQLENESPLNVVDVTQLEDVEAPSRLWENTATGDTILQTSPVKMVGLLRPSTILEENVDECTSCCSNSSSHVSFESALRSGDPCDVPSEPSSSYYETAHDSTATSCAINIAYDVYGTNAATSHNLSTDTNEQEENLIEDLIDLDESKDLIDLEKTFSPLQNSPGSAKIAEKLEAAKKMDPDSDLEESIIEISDGENSLEKETERSVSNFVKMEVKSMLSASSSEANYSADASSSSSVSLLKFDADKNCSYVGDAIGAEHSMKFDNTMEEVDYMLQKGLEYMAAANSVEKTPTIALVAKLPAAQMPVKENSFLMSSPKAKQQWVSPKKAMQKQKLLEGVCSSPRSKPSNRFALDIKPIPKFDIFKKPLPTNANKRQKELANKQFSHIVSPIGAYVKKTGTTPLLATIKPRTKNADLHNSSALRALEYESRLYKPKFEVNAREVGVNSPMKLSGVPAVTRTLPKKAYISSEYKHIVDERTPVTIPGGQKIQKYLESAMLPAVVRHEGKLKLPESSGAVSKLPAKTEHPLQTGAGPRRTDLGDLSVMSGDVSVYTIMDAQKF